MLFSEALGEWRPLPGWAAYLIQLGFHWPKRNEERRRIALISMPCESAGAGLVALGALVKGLGDPSANDIDGHYDALLRHARQYLESCRHCEMKCRPDLKRCGHTAEARGKVRRKGSTIWEISEKTDFAAGRLAFHRASKKLTWWPAPKALVGWQIEGEAPPASIHARDSLPEEPFREIVPQADVIRR